MDLEFKSNNRQAFLDSKKSQRQVRELQKVQLVAASKIWLFYKNSKECHLKLQQMVRSLQPKLNGLLSLERKVPELKFQQSCSLALKKLPELLTPLFLITPKNALSYQDYFIAICRTLVFASQWRDEQNQIKLIFKVGELIQQRKYVAKCAQILLILAMQYPKDVNSYITLFEQLFIGIFTLVDNGSNPQFQLEFPYLISKKLEAETLITLLKLGNIGKQTLLFAYQFIISRQQCDEIANLCFLLLLNQQPENDPILLVTEQQLAQLIPLLEKSSMFHRIVNKGSVSEAELNKLNLLYQRLKSMTPYIISNVSIYCGIMVKLLSEFELNFFRSQMMNDYKNLMQGQQLQLPKLKSLRKKPIYRQFYDFIDIPRWITKLEALSTKLDCTTKEQYQTDLSQLSYLLVTLQQMGVATKVELSIQINGSKVLQQRYEHFLLQTCTTYILIIDAELKAFNMQFLDDQEFSEFYLSDQSSKQQLQQLINFYLNLALYQIVGQKNDIQTLDYMQKLPNLLREFFQRSQRLHFYNWEMHHQDAYSHDEIFNSLPFIVKFPTRVKRFNEYLAVDKQGQRRNIAQMYEINEEGEMTIKQERLVEIRRGTELEDALDRLQFANMKDIYHVQFYNQMGLLEEGIDGGGITKEFITRVVNQAFDPSLGLFKETPERTIVPNPHFFKEDLNKYHFIGKLIGKAIYEGILIEKVLNQTFLNKVLGIKNTINDYKLFDLQTYQQICKLKSSDVTDFGLTFSLTENIYDQISEVDLIPQGRNVAVTNSNKQLYIALFVDFKINKQFEKQAQQFRNGLEQVIDSKLLRMFGHYELQLLISGKPTIDIQDLIANTKYLGYNQNDVTIRHFWEIMDAMSHEEQAQFLYFVSSCSRAPTQGFRFLDPLFQIQRIPVVTQADSQKLPSAQTCFNILKLPDYRNKELLKKKLIQAITSNTGFELA